MFWGRNFRGYIRQDYPVNAGSAEAYGVGCMISAAEFAYIFSEFGVEVMLFAHHSLISVIPERMHKEVWRDLSTVAIYDHHALEQVLGSDTFDGVVAGVKTICL